MNKKTATIIIGIMCFILAFMMTLQIRTIKQSESEILTLKHENELRDEIREWKDKYEVISDQVTNLNKIIENYRNASAGESSGLLKEELNNANMLAGLISVKGPGIKIILDDTKVLEQITLEAGYYDPNAYVIDDGDIMQIINDLRYAKAEAISINGQRVTANSEIYSSGKVITINSIRITSPFEITATGDSKSMSDYLKVRGETLNRLEQIGVEVTIERVEELIIPKTENVIIYNYTTILEEGE